MSIGLGRRYAGLSVLSSLSLATNILCFEVILRPHHGEEIAATNGALSALMDAVTLDDDDDSNLTEYLGKRGTQVSSQELIKRIKRWPRLRKYWPRIRRRICCACGKQYDLSEPRLWVCGGCGEARYCSETCQGAHWPEHKTPCVKKYFENVKKRRAQGESLGRIRQELLEWYGLPWPVG